MARNAYRLGVEGNVAFLRYGDRFRRGRKWVHDAFTSTALASYRSRQRREVNVLLKGVLTRPTAFTAHIARYALLGVYSKQSDTLIFSMLQLHPIVDP